MVNESYTLIATPAYWPIGCIPLKLICNFKSSNSANSYQAIKWAHGSNGCLIDHLTSLSNYFHGFQTFLCARNWNLSALNWFTRSCCAGEFFCCPRQIAFRGCRGPNLIPSPHGWRMGVRLLWWLIYTKGGEKWERSGSIYDVDDVRWTHGVGSSSLMRLTSSAYHTQGNPRCPTLTVQ